MAGLNYTGKTTIAKILSHNSYDLDYEQTESIEEYKTVYEINHRNYSFCFHDRNGYDFENTKSPTNIRDYLKQGRIHFYCCNASDESSIELVKGFYKSFVYHNSSVDYQVIILRYSIQSQYEAITAKKQIKEFCGNSPIWEINLQNDGEKQLESNFIEFIKQVQRYHYNLFEGCEAKMI